MTEEFTLIADLRARATFEDRADWLRRCPDSIVASHHQAIRDALVETQFASGIAYLWARLAMVQSVRQGDGRHHVEVEQGLVAADMRMGYRR